jgi:acyl-CoA synthetase (AMP-forming)/AMP-acid ligase II
VEKIWLKSYQQGVPAEVDLNEFQSLGELFEKSVAQHRERVAYINMGVQITYGELDKLSRDFAAYLQSVLKLPPGARVALMMPNVRRHAGLSESRCGQLCRQVRQEDGSRVESATRDQFPHALAKGASGTEVGHRHGPGRSRLPAVHRRHHRPLQGAMLTHRNMIANVLQASPGSSPGWSRRSNHMVVTALPLYHIFALTANCLKCSCASALQPADQQSARHPGLRQGAQEVSASPCITGVNTLFNALLNNGDFQELDFSR